MAVINPTRLPAGIGGEWDSSFRFQWVLAQGDEGAPVVLPRHADRSIEVTGAFDSGTVRLEGTISQTAYFPVTDPQGNDIAINSYPAGYSAKGEAISEAVVAVRPRVTGGGAATALTVTLFCRS